MDDRDLATLPSDLPVPEDDGAADHLVPGFHPEARLPVPTFLVEGVTLFRRTTLFLRDGRVEGVLYPVFPPDRAADDALAWLRADP